jgi:hypothetical protein
LTADPSIGRTAQRRTIDSDRESETADTVTLIRSLRSLAGAPSFAGGGPGVADTVTLIRSLRSLAGAPSFAGGGPGVADTVTLIRSLRSFMRRRPP